MALATNALTTVEKVKALMVGRADALSLLGLSIYHNGSGVTSATVTVTATTMALTTNLGTDTLTFADADTDTLTKLVGKINALTNWEAELLGPSDADSTSLKNVNALDAYLQAEVKSFQIDPDWVIEILINSSSQEIENYLGYQVKSATYNEYLSFQRGATPEFNLQTFPVSKLTRVAQGHLFVLTIQCDNSSASRATARITTTAVELTKVISGVATDNSLTIASYTTLADLKTAIDNLSDWKATINSGYDSWPTVDLVRRGPTDVLNTVVADFAVWEEDANVVEIDYDSGLLYLSGPPAGHDTIRVSYTAGYTSTPAPLETACIDLAVGMWDTARSDRTLLYERLADHSWRRGALQALLTSDAIRGRLDQYRDFRFS